MSMGRKRLGAIAATTVIAAAGTGTAIAVTGDDKDGRKAEDAVLDDAARRLDVTPDRLREALSAARAAELDRAVKAGRLTQEQADRIKQRRERSGRVLPGPPALRHRHHGGPGFARGGHGGPFRGLRRIVSTELAEALGVTRAELREALRDGKSVADVAKAEGKSLDDVRTALRAAAKQRLDAAVKDGKLTRERADRIAEHVERALEHLDATPPRFGTGHGRRGFGPPPGMPGPRPR